MKALFAFLASLLLMSFCIASCSNQHIAKDGIESKDRVKSKDSIESDVIWTCPSDESIACIRTAEVQEKLFVLTQRNDEWVLRTIDTSDKPKIIASGLGKSHFISLSVSYDGKSCLVFVKRDRQYIAVDCDVVTGKCLPVNLERISMEFTHQPYSLDGRWLVVKGPGLGTSWEEKRQHSIWLVDRKTKEVKRIHAGGKYLADLMWTEKKGLVCFTRGQGKLISEYGTSDIIKEYPPADWCFVPPDAEHLITVSREKQGLIIRKYNTDTSRGNVIYTDKTKDKDKANIFGFQYAPYSGETILEIMWPNISPVHISPQGICTPIEVSDLAWWRLSCGVAIWKPGTVAMVENAGEGKPDRIVQVHVK